MAESMVLRIVLEGVDNASDDIQKTDKSAKELKNTIDDNTMAAAGFLLAVNGLASGLNQVSGGLRKSADAGEELGHINEQQANQLRDLSRTLEFVAGPLEIIAGVFNLLASLVIIGKVIPATKLAALGFKALGVAAAIGTAPITGTVLIFTALAGALIALTLTIYIHRERLKELATTYLSLGGRIDSITNKISGAIDMVSNFNDAINMPGRSLIRNVRGSIYDETIGQSRGIGL